MSSTVSDALGSNSTKKASNIRPRTRAAIRVGSESGGARLNWALGLTLIFMVAQSERQTPPCCGKQEQPNWPVSNTFKRGPQISFCRNFEESRGEGGERQLYRDHYHRHGHDKNTHYQPIFEHAESHLHPLYDAPHEAGNAEQDQKQ